MPPADDIADLRRQLAHADAVIAELRRQLAHADAVIAELRGVVADLRKQVDAQHAHIHRLVKMTFGRGGERVIGPTPFDGIDPPEAESPPPA